MKETTNNGLQGKVINMQQKTDKFLKKEHEV